MDNSNPLLNIERFSSLSRIVSEASISSKDLATHYL